MEKYADNLEELVMERTGQLIEEKKKTDALLERMLPRFLFFIIKINKTKKNTDRKLERNAPTGSRETDSKTIKPGLRYVTVFS